jgi:hypothetical protein
MVEDSDRQTRKVPTLEFLANEGIQLAFMCFGEGGGPRYKSDRSNFLRGRFPFLRPT